METIKTLQEKGKAIAEFMGLEKDKSLDGWYVTERGTTSYPQYYFSARWLIPAVEKCRDIDDELFEKFVPEGAFEDEHLFQLADAVYEFICLQTQ
jgi:hypothetical protein